MGKALLLIATASLLGGGLMLFSGIQQSVLKADQKLGEHEARLMARQIALTGLSEARADVLGDPGAVGLPVELLGAHMGGTYRTTVTPGTDMLTLRVDGRMPLGSDQDAYTHTIEVVYSLVAGEGGGGGGGSGGGTTVVLPPFMHAAIISNTRVNGNNLTVRSLSPDVNANIRINASPNDLNNSSVDGFLYYHAASMDQGILNRLRPVFKPNSNPGAESVVQHRETIPVPTLNVTQFQNKAGVQTWPQNQQFRNAINLGGVPGNPAVWYVNGELSTNAAVTFSGYAVLIVRNNVNVNHQINTAEGSRVAIYTGSGFNFNSGMNISGLLFANGNIPIRNSTIRGSIIARGDVNINGATTVIYEAPPGDLVSPIFDVEIIEEPSAGEAVWRPTSYREWASQPSES